MQRQRLAQQARNVMEASVEGWYRRRADWCWVAYVHPESVVLCGPLQHHCYGEVYVLCVVCEDMAGQRGGTAVYFFMYGREMEVKLTGN